MATGPSQQSVFGWAVTAWRDAFAAVSAMPVALGVALLVVMALDAVSAIFIPRQPGESSGPGIELLSFLVGLVQGFLLTPAAIAVHRFVLLGERADSYRLTPADPIFRRFFIFTVIVQVIIGIPGLLAGMTERASGAVAAVAGLFGFALLIVAFVVTLRTLILFPAIAVDARGAEWGNALKDSKGHSWRILWIVLVAGLPLIAIYLPFFFWLWWPNGPSGAGVAVLVVIEATEAVLAAAIYAALASRLFVAFADRLAGPPVAPAG